MDRGKNFKTGFPHSSFDFCVAVLGNTTNPPTVPADGAFTPTTSTFPKRANGVDKTTAGAPTRSAQGRYVITYEHKLPLVFNAQGAVLSAGGAPTGGLLADVDSINPSTRQIAVRVATQAGVLTDLGVNDMLVLTVNAQDSTG